MIDRFIATTGKSVSWLAFVLVLVIIVDVFLRYTFSISSAGSSELEWHLFSVLFLLAAPWAFQVDRHVRVDVFHQRFSPKMKKWIELTGCVVLLLPFCAVGFWESIGFVKSAYLVGERSADPGGLPYRFLIKGAIPASFLLLGLQSISIILKTIFALRND